LRWRAITVRLGLFAVSVRSMLPVALYSAGES
jgi:hypothetical protein